MVYDDSGIALLTLINMNGTGPIHRWSGRQSICYSFNQCPKFTCGIGCVAPNDKSIVYDRHVIFCPARNDALKLFS
jgi:hypothetical protein